MAPCSLIVLMCRSESTHSPIVLIVIIRHPCTSPPAVVMCFTSVVLDSMVEAEVRLNTSQLIWYLMLKKRPHLLAIRVATFVHQSLSGVLPSYLADDCRLVTRWRSWGERLCVPQRAKHASWRGHTPPSAPSLTIFQQRLKTHLFRRSYPDLIIWHSDL